jgi:glycosyltransferase involved in cell wall biosynthesis
VTTWHIVTGEYPPTLGGVSDYTHAVASGLAAAGDEVHVWCPSADPAAADAPGVTVHAIAGEWTRADLRRLGAEMDRYPRPRRLLVQWVPHAFGRRSVNVGFCRWVRRRAGAGDAVDLMIHEPGFGFGEGGLRHHAAAALHRLMLVLLLGRAQRVWVAIPAWIDRIRPWARGRRDLTLCWLPVPASVPVTASADDVGRVRRSMTGEREAVIVGHFGTYSPGIRQALRVVVPALLDARPDVHVQLLGRGGDRMQEELRGLTPHGARVHVSGEVPAGELSVRLQACDLVLQPYPDGASTRRSTLMTALAHGLPVVTNVGWLSEPFWQGSDAVAAVNGDPAALTRTVADLAVEPERRGRLGAAARALYDARFSLRHVIAALRADTCEAAR